MDNNVNAINSNEQNEHKWWLLERIRNSSKKVLAPVIAAGSISLWWLPAATVPVTAATAASILTACSSDEPENPKDVVAPTVNVSQHDVDISWWKQVRISWNQLYIWDALVASRTDNVTKNCTVELSLNWKTISSWTIVNEWWILTIKVTDEAGNTKTIDIKLTMNNQLISWLENLQNLNMQVDQEVNLLNGITFWNGASLVKVEIEMDWQTTQITDPQHYTPQYPWQCTIILTVKDKNGNIVTERVDKNIKAIEYQAMEINNIRPVDILPIIWQVESWDKNVYEHIEHLRIAEATRIRDMMLKYGTGNHSAAEYQQLMSRLNTGMAMELPLWYDNYEVIWWWGRTPNPNNHALWERHTLNSIVPNANLKIVLPSENKKRARNLLEYARNNPNSISIIWLSMATPVYDKSWYINTVFSQDLIDLCDRNNIIIFVAGTNIQKHNWILKNKIYNEEYTVNEHGIYSEASMGNSKNNSRPNSHLLITVATDADGNIDQTGITYESTKYPVWFAKNSLFSGRGFPYLTEWKIYWPQWRYTTSDTNYLNVALSSLIFQLHADATNVNELLEMIRSTTLNDQITLDGETQQLQLINPAWFFKKYCMPTEIPNQINPWEIIPLNKWYYKWVIFDIPWAEVKINWQWIAYNDANKSLIKNQNPMNLQWRLNWNLCTKMWYKWKTINWKIIAVDDNWNGLNINNTISTKII